MRLECGKEPQFSCPASPACAYRSKQRSGVNRHVRMLHPHPLIHSIPPYLNQNHGPSVSLASPTTSMKLPQYSCNQCGKIYRWKQSLGLHQRLECGKEPQFQCPHCPHRAKQKGSLVKHISNKHPNSF
ncbi:hypothetical protein ONE63_006221 [Megalurothrips usitatus]|uniref:C2H2-type domain-containing protein n=1 Tax=Megalurothrips usitatus TaxID=439358 RepID=A0AAV7XSQ8_9NEOP|nr:hypothetical protein ONE63_006221 [Megalurothrips usitatus]